MVAQQLTLQAQNYKPFNSANKKLFLSNDSSAFGSLVFDSVKVQGNEIIYYPFKVINPNANNSDTGCTNASGTCRKEDYPSWIGDKIIERRNNNYILLNYFNDSLRFDFNNKLDTSVIYNKGQHVLKMLYVGISYENIYGFMDSVKNYKLLYFDSLNNPQNNMLHNAPIKIGKELGLLNFFQLGDFPTIKALPNYMFGQEEKNLGVFTITSADSHNYQAGDTLEYHGVISFSNHLFNNYKTICITSRVNTQDSIIYKINTFEIYANVFYPITTGYLRYAKRSKYFSLPFEKFTVDQSNNYPINTTLQFTKECDSLYYLTLTTTNNLCIEYCDSTKCYTVPITPCSDIKVCLNRVSTSGRVDYYVEGYGNIYLNPYYSGDLMYSNINGKRCGNYKNILGFSTIASNAAITLYPNPNNGLFTIQCAQATEATVTNLLGQIIAVQHLQQGVTTINITTQPKGIYFVKTPEQTFKLVIE